MLTLAIDTSHKSGGAALAKGGRVLGEVSLNLDTTHSRRMIACIDFLLERAGLDKTELQGLAVTLGPGYFTGLRIGLATAQGLALGLGLPVSGISTLRLLAMGAAVSPGVIWAVADARRNLVYAAAFENTGAELKRLGPDMAVDPRKLAGFIKAPALLAGDGASLYAKELSAPGLASAPSWAGHPRPGLLALEGEARLVAGLGIGPGELRPSYCRPSDAEIRFGLPLDDYNLVQ